MSEPVPVIVPIPIPVTVQVPKPIPVPTPVPIPVPLPVPVAVWSKEAWTADPSDNQGSDQAIELLIIYLLLLVAS